MDRSEFLSTFSARYPIIDVLDVIGGMAKLKVCMVGESIIDEYRYVTGLGKTGKENVLAVREESVEQFAGGVIAAAEHLRDICSDVRVVPDSHRRQVKKIRFIDRDYNRKLFETYELDDSPEFPPRQAGFDQAVARAMEQADIVIVTDFGHGLIAQSTIDIFDRAKFLAVNVQTNAGNRGFNLATRYHRADYLCLDEAEVRLAVQDRNGNLAGILARGLRDRIVCDHVVATRGRHGSLSCVGSGSNDPGYFLEVPAFSDHVVDTMGAGDAFFVISACAAAVGAVPEVCAFLGNVAGALKVGTVGHRQPVRKAAMIAAVKGLMG